MANGRRHELLGTAISGAVRFLNQVNLASREREPGSRLDHYRVPDDAWYAAAVRREQMLARWECGSTGVRPGPGELSALTAGRLVLMLRVLRQPSAEIAKRRQPTGAVVVSS